MGRLGNVVYWTATGLALIVLAGMLANITTQSPFVLGLGLVFTLLLWLAGVGVRYMFSGR